MELFGILFSIPVFALLGLGYRYIHHRYLSESHVVTVGSLLIVAIFTFELLLLYFYDITELSESLKNAFYPGHLVLCALFVPSSLSLIFKIPKSYLQSKPIFVVFASIALGLIVILVQYTVSEALNGIE